MDYNDDNSDDDETAITTQQHHTRSLTSFANSYKKLSGLTPGQGYIDVNDDDGDNSDDDRQKINKSNKNNTIRPINPYGIAPNDESELERTQQSESSKTALYGEEWLQNVKNVIKTSTSNPAFQFLYLVASLMEITNPTTSIWDETLLEQMKNTEKQQNMILSNELKQKSVNFDNKSKQIKELEYSLEYLDEEIARIMNLPDPIETFKGFAELVFSVAQTIIDAAIGTSVIKLFQYMVSGEYYENVKTQFFEYFIKLYPYATDFWKLTKPLYSQDAVVYFSIPSTNDKYDTFQKNITGFVKLVLSNLNDQNTANNQDLKESVVEQGRIVLKNIGIDLVSLRQSRESMKSLCASIYAFYKLVSDNFSRDVFDFDATVKPQIRDFIDKLANKVFKDALDEKSAYVKKLYDLQEYKRYAQLNMCTCLYESMSRRVLWLPVVTKPNADKEENLLVSPQLTYGKNQIFFPFPMIEAIMHLKKSDYNNLAPSPPGQQNTIFYNVQQSYDVNQLADTDDMEFYYPVYDSVNSILFSIKYSLSTCFFEYPDKLDGVEFDTNDADCLDLLNEWRVSWFERDRNINFLEKLDNIKKDNTLCKKILGYANVRIRPDASREYKTKATMLNNSINGKYLQIINAICTNMIPILEKLDKVDFLRLKNKDVYNVDTKLTDLLKNTETNFKKLIMAIFTSIYIVFKKNDSEKSEFTRFFHVFCVCLFKFKQDKIYRTEQDFNTAWELRPQREYTIMNFHKFMKNESGNIYSFFDVNKPGPNDYQSVLFGQQFVQSEIELWVFVYDYGSKYFKKYYMDVVLSGSDLANHITTRIFTQLYYIMAKLGNFKATSNKSQNTRTNIINLIKFYIRTKQKQKRRVEGDIRDAAERLIESVAFDKLTLEGAFQKNSGIIYSIFSELTKLFYGDAEARKLTEQVERLRRRGRRRNNNRADGGGGAGGDDDDDNDNDDDDDDNDDSDNPDDDADNIILRNKNNIVTEQTRETALRDFTLTRSTTEYIQEWNLKKIASSVNTVAITELRDIGLRYSQPYDQEVDIDYYTEKNADTTNYTLDVTYKKIDGFKIRNLADLVGSLTFLDERGKNNFIFYIDTLFVQRPSLLFGEKSTKTFELRDQSIVVENMMKLCGLANDELRFSDNALYACIQKMFPESSLLLSLLSYIPWSDFRINSIASIKDKLTLSLQEARDKLNDLVSGKIKFPIRELAENSLPDIGWIMSPLNGGISLIRGDIYGAIQQTWMVITTDTSGPYKGVPLQYLTHMDGSMPIMYQLANLFANLCASNSKYKKRIGSGASKHSIHTLEGDVSSAKLIFERAYNWINIRLPNNYDFENLLVDNSIISTLKANSTLNDKEIKYILSVTKKHKSDTYLGYFVKNDGQYDTFDYNNYSADSSIIYNLSYSHN